MASQYYYEPQGYPEHQQTPQHQPIDMQQLRPGTPGTFQTVENKYNHPNGSTTFESAQYSRGGYDSHQPGNTYYFSESGAGNRGAAGAAAGGAAAGAYGARAGAGGARGGSGPIAWIKRHPWWTALIALIVLVLAGVGAGLGAGLGSKSNSTSSGDSQSDTSGGSSKGSGSGSGSATGTASAPGASSTPAPPTPLPKWNWTDPKQKMYGVSLGNWLLLERWMSEDWMVNTAGADAWDEWTFIENLGKDKALAALQDHWNSWVTEDEIEVLHQHGLNHIRIPLGYWAFVPAAPGEPYLAQSGQLEQVDKLLKWLYDRKMYAMIDLHGMPGSQNADQSSGHNTSSLPQSQQIQWFTDANQALSDKVIDATIAYAKNHTYTSVITSIGIVNEPRPNNDDGKLGILTDFYTRSYRKVKNAGFAAFFHHGFYSKGSPLEYWRDFATGKDPNFLVYEDHPYPGWFPPNSDQEGIVNTVCGYAQRAVGFPIPMAITEWSATSNVGSDQFSKEYFNTEVAAWAWSAGSTFWSFKANHSTTRVLGERDEIQDLYSFMALIDKGIVPKPSSPDQSALDIISALPNQQCGKIVTPSWSTPSKSGDGYQGRRRSVSSSDEAPVWPKWRRNRLDWWENKAEA